jgi:hypothetical protein
MQQYAARSHKSIDIFSIDTKTKKGRYEKKHEGEIIFFVHYRVIGTKNRVRMNFLFPLSGAEILEMSILVQMAATWTTASRDREYWTVWKNAKLKCSATFQHIQKL